MSRLAVRDARQRLGALVGRVARLIGVLCAALLASAHVGTTDAAFDGMAGPYPVRVAVRMPGVIPGQAQISVRVAGGGARRVLVQAAQWNVGARGAPAPDEAGRVDGDSTLWAAPLWLMTRSSYLVHVTVEGARGRGTASIPVIAQATARLGMDRALGWGLAVLGTLLVAGLLTMAGTAAREAVLEPGAVPDRRRRLAGRIATSVMAGVAALALLGGSRWWRAVDASYERYMFRPLASEAHVARTDSGAVLRFVVTDSLFFSKRQTPLIPDHGKLMHLFAVREPGLDVLAHLHPTRTDSATFESRLPPLPTGRYRVYADVVHESGLARTLVATAELPAAPATRADAAAPDRPAGPRIEGAGDDAWLVGAPVGAADACDGAPPVAALGDGLAIRWENGCAFRAGADTTLRFTVRDAAGAVVEVEPYMGMGAHAMVMRRDGTVFVHLHPMGTISMAAQERLLRRDAGDTVLHGADQPADAAAHARHAATADVVRHPGTLGFPFAFPKEGAYRIWVQVRHGGRVRTAAFDATVGG